LLAFSRFIRYFRVVARAGSIRRASDVLNVSASAIDRQILRAEQELQVPLFERLPTGLRLTAAGELLMSASGDWLKSFDRVRTQMADLQGLRRGHVAIAVIDALNKGFLPQIVRRIRETYPGISFSLSVLDNVEVARALARGDVDFGIMLDPQPSRELVVRAQLDVVLGFATLPDHELAGQSRRRFSACADHLIVAPQEPLALCQQVRALEASTSTSLRVAAVSDNIDMIKALVGEGVGVGILTSLDVAVEVRRGQLAFTPISDPAARTLTLGLCQAPSRQLSSAANMVLDQIEAYFTERSAAQLDSAMDRGAPLAP
jgi:DNA-binding transcriptional LysR family regulator